MKLAKFLHGNQLLFGLVETDSVIALQPTADFPTLSSLLDADDPEVAVDSLRRSAARGFDEIAWLPPIDSQEVWAAGVTYKRSQAARMEESEVAADCYERVYRSPRPELFFKATPNRVAGHLQPLRIRVDSQWNVPEPEVTLVLNQRVELVGFTIGNDMSSRDIEGDNPLYLPQAKVYDQCAGLGPWITLVAAMPAAESIGVRLRILRGDAMPFEGQTDCGCMARSFNELIQWLSRDNSFPNGAFLMTGTGVVPDSNFTLAPGDVVEIEVDGIGKLVNPIVQGPHQ